MLKKTPNDPFEYGTASYEKQATGSKLPLTAIVSSARPNSPVFSINLLSLSEWSWANINIR